VDTVLIVEDQPANRKLLSRLLSRTGRRAVTALDGEDALAVARRERPSLVIADVLMPRMNGFEFVRQLRADPAIAGTKVIFYTGSFIEPESIALAKACGVSHVISKAAEPAEICALIDEVLGTGSPAADSKVEDAFGQRHLRLITDKLSEKVCELEKLNAELEHRVYRRTAELAAANARLLELNKMKSEFLAIVSHDLRSPLSSILLAAKMLAAQGERMNPSERKSILEQVAVCANEQITFANDLLALACSESTEARLELSDVKLSDVARDAVRTISFPAAGKRLSMEVSAPPDEFAITGDRPKIAQIFGNLLTNALKFTPKGGHIRIKIESEPSGACVRVSDTGVGIPAPQLSHLFEKFKALRTVGTAGETGTGLGLAIVRQAVEQHGGTIEVESRPGAGTTFTFRLPSRPPTMPAAQPRKLHPKGAHRRRSPGSSNSARKHIPTQRFSLR